LGVSLITVFILPGSFLIVYVKQKNKETVSIHFIVNQNICFAMSEYFFQRTEEDKNLDNVLGQAQHDTGLNIKLYLF
jgi:hypothetical protein